MAWKCLIISFVSGTVLGLLGRTADAATVASIGDGSAVTFIDRVATFDGLTMAHNETPLEGYTEGLLKISTPANSWAGNGINTFDPFKGGGGSGGVYSYYDGNNDWVTIQTTDSKKIFAAEFLYGNTWTNGNTSGSAWGNSNALMDWQTWSGDTLISSGSMGPGAPAIQHLPVGTVLGFADPDGFDRLLVRATISGNGTLQTLAMDNLRVQITAALVWTGTVNGTWDVNSTANFSGNAPGKFNDGDHVTFDDLGSNTAITIAAGGVAPGSVTFSNTITKDYSLSGGPITGATSLLLSGGGKLTLSGTNTYTLIGVHTHRTLIGVRL
jgi:hypothetical protein